MREFFIYFLKTKFDETEMLGKKISEFLLEEFENCNFQIADNIKQPLTNPGNVDYIAIVPMNMAILTVKELEKLIANMWKQDIDHVEIGEGEIFKVNGKPRKCSYFVNSDGFLQMNDAKSFELMYNVMRERIVFQHLEKGVKIFDLVTTHIDATVEIESGAEILPFSRLTGKTILKKNSRVSASFLHNTVVKNGAKIEMSHIVDSEIGENSTIGPFARLRQAKIGKNARVGDFVEIKGSDFGNESKVAHLTYIGDADVGTKVNVGCGTVFCNYDGKLKHKTQVGDNCFIGANTNLIAPLKIGKDCFVAAGTTVTENVDDGSFVISRVKQKTSERSDHLTESNNKKID